jgi:hypothetical protein
LLKRVEQMLLKVLLKDNVWLYIRILCGIITMI